jgi:hypothetical protein
VQVQGLRQPFKTALQATQVREALVDLYGKIFRPDGLAGGEDKGALDEVSQLADVAGKVVDSELLDRLWLDLPERDFQVAHHLFTQIFDERRDVGRALAQRRDMERDDRQAVMRDARYYER